MVIMGFRTTIYVPAELKRRMDEAKRTNPGLSWSSLARRAFEQKLGEIAARKKDKNMMDVIQRLRATELKAKAKEAAEGQNDGYAWARENAEARQLKSLSDAREQAGCAWTQWYGPGGDASDQSLAKIFVYLIGDEEADQDQVSEFWDEVLGEGSDKAESNEYVFGFMEGALEVWDEVAHQM